MVDVENKYGANNLRARFLCHEGEDEYKGVTIEKRDGDKGNTDYSGTMIERRDGNTEKNK